MTVTCNKLQAFIEKQWYQPKNFLTYLLLPLSWLFSMVVRVRRFLYRHRILKSTKFDVPIIVVGNLTVGGSGKTPLVIALASKCRAEGYRVGIVSRGYGSNNQGVTLVTDDHSAAEVGDEPFMIFHKTQLPVAVAAKRCRAVEALIDKKQSNLIIADDGLQHYAMQRAIEIVVIDGKKKFGNRLPLPAGPLREPIARLKTADFIVVNGETRHKNDVTMKIVPDHLTQVSTEAKIEVAALNQSAVHAVAGIASPERFFTTLRAMGLTFEAHAFPDHHVFTPEDFQFQDNAMIVMTEKDAVKCRTFADDHFWYLPIHAELSDDFYTSLFHCLDKK